MKNGGQTILLIGVLLFGCLLASLLSMSKALQTSAQFDEIYAGLLIFNTLGLLTLVVLIGRISAASSSMTCAKARLGGPS